MAVRKGGLEVSTGVMPPAAEEAIRDLVPLLEGLVEGRHAVALGGSIGKGLSDAKSDLDLRLFYDALAGPERLESGRAEVRAQIASWGRRGVPVDGYWPRRIADVEALLESQLAGGEPLRYTWTIWGYHALTDLSNLLVLSDRWGVIAGWKERLRVYPASLRKAVLEKHIGELRYWVQDYHYRHKAERGDAVFCFGLAAKLVHSMMQVLFALNGVYYVGDGKNLEVARGFSAAPRDLETRVRGALFLPDAPGSLQRQREELLALIDDVLALVEEPIEPKPVF
jgi:hypothetical protein